MSAALVGFLDGSLFERFGHLIFLCQQRKVAGDSHGAQNGSSVTAEEDPLKVAEEEQLKDFNKVEGVTNSFTGVAFGFFFIWETEYSCILSLILSQEPVESKIEIKDETFNIVKKPSIIKPEMRNKSKEKRKSDEAPTQGAKDGGNSAEAASEGTLSLAFPLFYLIVLIFLLCLILQRSGARCATTAETPCIVATDARKFITSTATFHPSRRSHQMIG